MRATKKRTPGRDIVCSWNDGAVVLKQHTKHSAPHHHATAPSHHTPHISPRTTRLHHNHYMCTLCLYMAFYLSSPSRLPSPTLTHTHTRAQKPTRQPHNAQCFNAFACPLVRHPSPVRIRSNALSWITPPSSSPLRRRRCSHAACRYTERTGPRSNRR